MKTLLLFLSFLYCDLQAAAQNFTQVIEFNKFVNYTVLADNQGDIYLCGYDKDFNAGGLWWNDTGLTVYKIRKYDPATKAILWEKLIYSNNTVQIYSVRMRQSGILLAGFYKDTICVDGKFKTSLGESDVFVASVDPSGNIQVNWQGGIGNETVYGLDIDKSGNVYMTGTLLGQAQIGNASYNAGSKTAFYLLKMDSLLTPIWRKIGIDAETGNGVTNGFGLQIHNSHLYFIANGRTTFEFTTDTFGCGSVCGTLPEFDLNGNLIREPHPFGSYYYHGAGICFKDVADDFYYTEYSTANHGPDQFEFGKLDKQLNPKWGFKPACTFLDYHSIIKMNNEFVLGGPITGAADSAGYAIVRGDLQNGIAIQYSLFPMPQGTLHRSQLQPYKDGGLLLSGNQHSMVVLGTYTLNKGSFENADGFIAVLQPGHVGLNELDQKAGISFFPNPTKGSLSFYSDQAGIIRIVNLQGITVLTIEAPEGKTEKDLNLAAGIYFAQFTNARKQRQITKIIVE